MRQFMHEPPLTLMAWPVMFLAWSEARNEAMYPMSSGVWPLPMGILSRMFLSKTSSEVSPLVDSRIFPFLLP